jgi:hypothetical protein
MNLNECNAILNHKPTRPNQPHLNAGCSPLDAQLSLASRYTYTSSSDECQERELTYYLPNIVERYTIGEQIGEGSFGNVFLAVKNDTNEKVKSFLISEECV